MNEKQLAVREEPSVALMLQGIIEKGVTAENVAVMGQLIALKERMDTKQAEKDFSAAFVALQSDLPVIVAKTEIKNRGKYERFEDVMNVVSPLLKKHGFCVSFSNAYDDNRIIETCKLSHIGGHSQSNNFAVRVGKNADSDTQADCKAATTAKRNALLNALNIVIRQDCLQNEEDNGELDGGTITPQEALELRDWCEAVDADLAKFLAFARASKFEEITTAMLPELHRFLRAKERAKKGDLL